MRHFHCLHVRVWLHHVPPATLSTCYSQPTSTCYPHNIQTTDTELLSLSHHPPPFAPSLSHTSHHHLPHFIHQPHRTQEAVTTYSFSSGSAANPSHPRLPRGAERSGGRALCRQATPTVPRKTLDGRALQRAETPGGTSLKEYYLSATSRHDHCDEGWGALSKTRMRKLTNT